MSFKKYVSGLVFVVLCVSPLYGGGFRADGGGMKGRIHIHGSNYKELRQSLKQELYLSQCSLMPEKKYYSFIDPYLKQAEKQFKSFGFCKNNPQSGLVSDYLKALVKFNVACFMYYVDPAKKNDFDHAFRELVKCCESIQSRGMKINVKNECDQIKEFLLQVNKAYCTKLGIK